MSMLTDGEPFRFSARRLAIYTSRPAAKFFLRVLNRAGLDLNDIVKRGLIGRDIREHISDEWIAQHGSTGKRSTKYHCWTMAITHQLKHEGIAPMDTDCFGHKPHRNQRRKVVVAPPEDEDDLISLSTDEEEALAWGCDGPVRDLELEWGV